MAEYSIRDIARMAGVSVGTVSRILNNADNVSDEIRRRTLDVIRQVNYQAGRRGRRPVHTFEPVPERNGRKIRTIAMLSPGMSSAWKGNELWTTFLSGIERACGERGARLAIYMADMNPDEIVREISQSADGVLIKTNQVMPDYTEELISRLPCVGFGALPTPGAYPQVVLDNHAGGAIAVRELLQMGHRRIAFLNHEAQNGIFIARSNGYIEVMKSEGLFRNEYLLELQLAEYHSITAPETVPPDLSGALGRLMALPEPPTAVVVGNDWGAFGLLRACRARGMRVPEDLSIIGMDDSGNLPTLVTPTLASVAMPFDQVAYFASCTLCDLMEGVGTHQRNVSSIVQIAGELKKRDSIRPESV